MLSSTETLNQSAPSLTGFVERIRAGDVRALARAITAIENDSAQASQLMKALFPFSGNATVIGLTGSPGAGKSTLVDQLARGNKKRRSASSPLIRRVLTPAEPFSAIASACRLITPTMASTSAAWRHADSWEDSLLPPPTLQLCSTPRGRRSFSSRPLA